MHEASRIDGDADVQLLGREVQEHEIAGAQVRAADGLPLMVRRLVDGSSTIPGLMNPTASRSVIDKMAQAMLHDDTARLSLPPSFVPSALAEIVVVSDFWSPIPEIRSMVAGLSASGAHGTMVQVVDPAEESFPYSGRIEFVEPESGHVITAGRAERWAEDYAARVALHRDQIRTETNKLDWLFSTHNTGRSAAELLLFLHSGMMVNKGSVRTSTVKAGRSA